MRHKSRAARRAQRLQHENARLRAKLEKVQAHDDRGVELLFELLRTTRMLRIVAIGYCRCHHEMGCNGCPCMDPDGWCSVDNMAKSLGIEVGQ